MRDNHAGEPVRHAHISFSGARVPASIVCVRPMSASLRAHPFRRWAYSKRRLPHSGNAASIVRQTPLPRCAQLNRPVSGIDVPVLPLPLAWPSRIPGILGHRRKSKPVIRVGPTRFRPLCLSVSQGYWVNLLKVTRAGVLSRHRHTNPVHGYVLKGRWHYLEHDWVAEQGGYVYEPPGETHTLVVPEDVEEMITLFQVNGIMLYVDPDGNALGYEDVFSKIAMCCRHYQECGLGADYVERFIR
jgi:2,4'-dihydroxyacetophenone dioxygenase